LTDDIRGTVAAAAAGFIGARDRALALLGFEGAFRRSELVALDAADVAFNRHGLTVTLRRSKPDHEGAGRKLGIPYGSNPDTCPAPVQQGWLEVAHSPAAPVFPNQSAWADAGRAALSRLCWTGRKKARAEWRA
jgi:hypothetical protein